MTLSSKRSGRKAFNLAMRVQVPQGSPFNCNLPPQFTVFALGIVIPSYFRIVTRPQWRLGNAIVFVEAEPPMNCGGGIGRRSKVEGGNKNVPVVCKVQILTRNSICESGVMADTSDLKSLATACGFESHLLHQSYELRWWNR